MSWEAIGAIGEMISAFAVVVSIIYLSIQIRSNTRATRGSASYEAAHSWAQTNEQVGQLPDKVLELFVQANRPDFSADRWSEVDRLRMTHWYRSIFQKLEGQYFLYSNGLFDADLWEKRRAIGNGMIKPLYQRAWWDNELELKTFSAGFVHAIETAPASIDVALLSPQPAQ